MKYFASNPLAFFGRFRYTMRVKATKKKQFSSSDWLKHTAVHEAGHAVMVVHFGFPLGSVSIEPGSFYAGITHAPESGEFMTQHPDRFFGLEKEIIILMAGTEAVKAVLPDLLGGPSGDQGDLEQINIRAHDLCLYTEESEESARRRLRSITGWYMADPAIRGAVVDVANELLDKRTLGKRAAKKFINQVLDMHHRKFYPNG